MHGLVTAEELDAAGIVDVGPTRSALEHRLLALVKAAQLSAPFPNQPIGPYVVDFAWPAQRVVVETDGYAFHGHRMAFERDRARDADLQARGYAVLRFTWRQVRDEGMLVVARIAQLLAARA